MKANFWSRHLGRTCQSAFLVMFGLFLVIFILTIINQRVIQPTFHELEEEQAFEDNDRIQASIKNELYGLANLVNDWANWDEAYAFAQHPTQGFIKANYPDPASLSQNSAIDLLAIFNSQRQNLLYGAFHPSKGQNVQLDLFQGSFPLAPKMFDAVFAHEKSMDGIVGTEHGLMLLVARPILSSLKQGPSRGLLIMGRFLTDSRMDCLARKANVDVQLLSYQEGVAFHQPLSQASSNIVRHNDSIDKLLLDIEGNPLVFLHTPVRGRIEALGTQAGKKLTSLLGFISFTLLVCLAVYRSRLITLQHNLEERESLYRQLFEAESDAIFLVDNATGKILEANHAASCLYGYSHDELLAKINSDLSAEPEETRRLTHETSQAEEDIVSIPLRFHRKSNGTVFPVEITGRFFMHKTRSVHLAAVRDISERKKIEDQLRFTQFAIDHSADGAFWVHKDGRLFYVNQEGCRSLGYTEDELQKMTIKDIDPEFSFDLWPEYWDELKIRKNILLESKHKTKNGDIFPIEIRANYVEFNGDEFNCAIVRDISFRKRMEKERNELEAINWQLQKEESLNRMAGAIAHHFNNRMMGIIGFLELAMDESFSDNKDNYIKIALTQAKKSSELGVLMLTYLGQTPNATLVSQDISKACQSYMPILQAIMPDGVDLKTQFQTPGPIVKINTEHLQHIITNLVTNGLEALEQKTGQIELTVTSIDSTALPKDTLYFPATWQMTGRAWACITVIDNGCGISANHLEKLFDPFFTSKFVGRGLGLPVVLGLVKVHRGMITVNSKQGEGSVFRIYLPIEEETTA